MRECIPHDFTSSRVLDHLDHIGHLHSPPPSSPTPENRPKMLSNPNPSPLLLKTTLLLSLLLSPSPAAAITVAARRMLIEATPLVVTIEDHYASDPTATFINGLPDLWQTPTIDLDAGAEVHVLHDAPANPDLRIITTVAEVFYRIVGLKSANITSGDPLSLKGKRIGVVKNSTSEYFAYRYLKDVAGLKEDEYTFVGAPAGSGLCLVEPCGNGTFPYMLKHGEIDAVTAYEPTTEIAIRTIGKENAAVFRNDSLYRELSVMYTTKAKLDDPIKRKEIVKFLRALNKVQKVFAQEPEKIWGRVANITGSGVKEETLKAIWPMTRWTGGLPGDMADLLVSQDEWIVRDKTLQPNRGVMGRKRVESHIDDGPWRESLREE